MLIPDLLPLTVCRVESGQLEVISESSGTRKLMSTHGLTGTLIINPLSKTS